jgi:hypothetical protein
MLLDMLRSTIDRHLSHSALEFCHATQLEAHLQAVPVEQFPENHETTDKVVDRSIAMSPKIPAQTLMLKQT